MKNYLAAFLITLVLFSLTQVAVAQHPPAIGYMFPPGGQAGQTIDVILGGYEWTPDMQLFAHDRRIQFEIMGAPSPVIVPEPPYWFGKKSAAARNECTIDHTGRLPVRNPEMAGCQR